MKKGRKIVAPERVEIKELGKTLFLAGTIDNGKSEDWQSEVAKELVQEGWNVFNPRRENWGDLSDEKMEEQINWEMDYLIQSEVILFNFLPNSNSIITMLELGFNKDKKCYVCCPKEYFRYKNIEVFCRRYNIPVFQNLNELLKKLKNDV